MRIVHVVTRLLRAGSEENTLACCRWQAEAGHEVVLVHGAEADAAPAAAAGVRCIALPEMVHPIRPYADARALAALRRLYLRLAPDVVHSHQSKAGVLGRLAADVVPEARVIHGLHLLPWAHVSGARRRVYLAAERAVAGRTDAFIGVSRALCEHFALSRSELFEVVAIHGYRTFDQIVEAHGTGRGCDICKPAVASILASQLNGHVLSKDNRTLQDTNDAFLANIQRNGTYSVVPRIPGGEITPEKLIVIGEVARDYGLYTKITGGQRIDLFGARMEQLPEIWKRLVDAGFESGHAYGKSLRTVKSCVGSTWCRYGVQDSVGMAIALELRYRGLRSPHKLKGGVSGCARECAEARSKDFGIIATEKGWNLYVGGNGGATPVHARLLAGDLDDETLVRYLDRYLMYYIRTADRLQRTAPWVDSLDGGLDRLKAVVVDDVLGLGSELEASMERHVATYFDEWRATIEDPEKLARFVSFVNAPGVPDPHISFETEREQIRPADPVALGATIPVGAPSTAPSVAPVVTP